MGTKSKTESFMKNFDPVNSNREMRKFLRVKQSSGDDGKAIDHSKRTKRR